MLDDDIDEGTVCQSSAVSTANDVPARPHVHTTTICTGVVSTLNHRTLCWILCLTYFLVVVFYYYEQLSESWKVTVKYPCSSSKY